MPSTNAKQPVELQTYLCDWLAFARHQREWFKSIYVMVQSHQFVDSFANNCGSFCQIQLLLYLEGEMVVPDDTILLERPTFGSNKRSGTPIDSIQYREL